MTSLVVRQIAFIQNKRVIFDWTIFYIRMLLILRKHLNVSLGTWQNEPYGRGEERRVTVTHSDFLRSTDNEKDAAVMHLFNLALAITRPEILIDLKTCP